MGQLHINDWVNMLGSLDFNDFNDESSSKKDVTEYEGKAEDDPQETLLNLKDQIKELKDHGLDLIIKKETPMKILNLTLQEQHQNVLEGLFSKDDDYVDQIKCAIVDENVQMQQRLGNNIEPNVHLYLVQVSDDLFEGGNRWTQIKNMINLDESLNEEQLKQLWDLLEEFQEVFAWHKMELGQCFVKEHSIDTQGLPPYHMTPEWMSYWEEA